MSDLVEVLHAHLHMAPCNVTTDPAAEAIL